MSARFVGLDLSDATTRVVEGCMRHGAFQILRAAELPTANLAAGLRALGVKGGRAVCGVTGRDMILRTTQVPPVPAWQLKELMAFEIDEIAEQSGDPLSADFNLLTGAHQHSDDDMVLLALVRDSLIEEGTALVQRSGLALHAFTPNGVALHNAAVATDGCEGTVLVASVGEANTDIALVQDGDLLFARNLSGGGNLFTEALAAAFRVDAAKAAAALRRLGAFARPGEKLEGQRGAVARALEGALRQVTGMLQSSLMLCRTQLGARELELDRVLLCGPGAAIPRMDEALTHALGRPVERFDPASAYATDEAAPLLDERGPDFAVATGLSMMGALRDSYRIEILSASERRRRRFREKTAWVVAAFVLVLLHLGSYLWLARGDEQRAVRDAARLRREVESRKAALRDYQHMVSDVAELGRQLSALEDRTSPGAGLVTVMDLLDAVLPEELWVTSIQTMRAIEPGFGHGGQRHPFILVEGRGTEIVRNLADAVTELTTRLRGHPAVAGVLPRMRTDVRGDFTFELRIDTSVLDASAGPGDDPRAGA